MLLTSGEYRLEMLQKVLPCTVQRHSKNSPAQNVRGAEAETPRSEPKRRQQEWKVVLTAIYLCGTLGFVLLTCSRR